MVFKMSSLMMKICLRNACEVDHVSNKEIYRNLAPIFKSYVFEKSH